MGHEALQFTPDIIAAGKGLGGGYVPIGGVYCRPDVVAPIAETDLALMFSTFAGHDLCCAVAKKVLEIVGRKISSIERIMGEILRERLEQEFKTIPMWKK